MTRVSAFLTLLGFVSCALAIPIAQIVESSPFDDILSHTYPPGNYLPPGRPPVPPPGFKPTFLTIFTEAEVTFCRPWPSKAFPSANEIQFIRGTPLNITCWAPDAKPAPKPTLDGLLKASPGGGGSDPSLHDVWIRTEGNGCYISEIDLRNQNVNYEEFLTECQTLGPRPLGGNNPLSPILPVPLIPQPALVSPVVTATPIPAGIASTIAGTNTPTPVMATTATDLPSSSAPVIPSPVTQAAIPPTPVTTLATIQAG